MIQVFTGMLDKIRKRKPGIFPEMGQRSHRRCGRRGSGYKSSNSQARSVRRRPWRRVNNGSNKQDSLITKEGVWYLIHDWIWKDTGSQMEHPLLKSEIIGAAVDQKMSEYPSGSPENLLEYWHSKKGTAVKQWPGEIVPKIERPSIRIPSL